MAECSLKNEEMEKVVNNLEDKFTDFENKEIGILQKSSMIKISQVVLSAIIFPFVRCIRF